MRNPIDIQQALDYEIESSWWADCIGSAWLQELVARYFAWKVKRKLGRVFAKNRYMVEIYKKFPDLHSLIKTGNQNPKP